MGELKEKMKDDLELRCYKPSTITMYLRQVERFAQHHQGRGFLLDKTGADILAIAQYAKQLLQQENH